MGSLSERDTGWMFDLTATSLDKRTSRVSIKAPASSELRGVDGSFEGALRPFPGFTTVHEFSESAWGLNHDTTSNIIDLFPVNFIIGDDGYGFGFVYRVQRKTGSTTCDVFIDYFSSKNDRWYRSIMIKSGVPLSPTYSATAGRQMSVSVFGRLVYVYIGDSEPALFYTLRDTPWTYQVVTDTGPGLKPALASPRNAGALGSIVAINDAGRGGQGQIFLTQYKPSQVSLGLGSGTGSSGGSGTIEGQDDSEVALLDPGDYAFAYVLYDSTTGRRSPLSEIAQARKEDFDPDGSGTQPATGLYAAIEIVYDTTLYDQAYIYRSVRVQDAGGTYIASILQLDRIIRLADPGYASSNNPLADPDQAQSIYFYELEDKALIYQDVYIDRAAFDENIPKGGASYWYENTMLVSAIRTNEASVSNEIRKDDSLKGLGELRWSSLTNSSPELFSPNDRYIPHLPSNEIIKMVPVGANVVGFSRDRQYHIRKESAYIKVQEMHEGFGVVNDRAAETVGSLIYFVGPKGVKSVDGNGQLDDVRGINKVIVEDWASSLKYVSVAYDPLMSALFIMNSDEDEAYVFWFNTAMVTSVVDLPFETCARGAWPQGFVYDQADLARTTSTNDTYYNPLVERAFFVANSPKANSSETISGFKFRVYQVDNTRSKTQTTGSRTGFRRTLMPLQGDSVFALASNFSSSNQLTFTVNDADTHVNKRVETDVWNLKLYVLKASVTTLEGLSVTVKSSSATNTLLVNTPSVLYGLVTGDIVGLSPVNFEWGGAPLPVQDEEGIPFGPVSNKFRVKHADTLGCCFTDVITSASGSFPSTGVISFGALAFKGSSATEDLINYSLDGSGTRVQSITENEGIYYAGFRDTTSVLTGRFGVDAAILCPGVRIICPDIDYRLVGVFVSGDVRATQRTQRMAIP